MLLPELEASTHHTFVSLIKATIQELVGRKASKIGLLASPTTIKTKLYENALRRNGTEVLLPSDDELILIETCIRDVIAGKSQVKLKVRLQPIVERLKALGCQAVILGCTELSVIFSGAKDQRLVDPMDIIIKELVE